MTGMIVFGMQSKGTGLGEVVLSPSRLSRTVMSFLISFSYTNMYAFLLDSRYDLYTALEYIHPTYESSDGSF